MWKKCLFRGLISYCISVTLILLSTLIAVLCGSPMACVPAFVDRVGSEIAASLLQPLLIGLIGFAFGAGSVLLEVERWSFLQQGLTHFAVTAAVWFIVEVICFFPLTPPAVLSFALSAAFTYAVTWSAQYFVWRNQVRKLNEQIHRKNEENPS